LVTTDAALFNSIPRSLEDKLRRIDLKGIQKIIDGSQVISQYKINRHYLKFSANHGKIQASFTHNIHFRRQA
jgi:hypothetical protein